MHLSMIINRSLYDGRRDVEIIAKTFWKLFLQTVWQNSFPSFYVFQEVTHKLSTCEPNCQF